MPICELCNARREGEKLENLVQITKIRSFSNMLFTVQSLCCRALLQHEIVLDKVVSLPFQVFVDQEFYTVFCVGLSSCAEDGAEDGADI